MAASALGLAQAGAGFAGASSQADSARLGGKIEQQQAEFNARVSEFQGEEAIRRGKREAELARKAGAKVKGSQRAALAAQGIALDEGTALELQKEAAEITAEDVETIKNNAAAEAFGFKMKAGQERFKGQLARGAAEAEASSTLLTGGLKFGLQGLESGVGAGKFLSRQFGKKKSKSDIIGEQATKDLVRSEEKVSNVDAAYQDFSGLS